MTASWAGTARRTVYNARWSPTRLQKFHRLREVLDGVELDQAEERLLVWASVWEEGTYETFEHLLFKQRRAGLAVKDDALDKAP